MILKREQVWPLCPPQPGRPLATGLEHPLLAGASVGHALCLVVRPAPGGLRPLAPPTAHPGGPRAPGLEHPVLAGASVGHALCLVVRPEPGDLSPSVN